MSSEVIRRRTNGKSASDVAPVIGIAALSPIDSVVLRKDSIRVIRGCTPGGESLGGYAGLVTDRTLEEVFPNGKRRPDSPLIYSAEHLEHIQDGDVLKLDFRKGYIQSQYRVNSPNNVIFATDQCNSNCIMCSQPPKDIDDSETVREHLRLVSLIPRWTPELGITGGEPTVLGEGLFRILEACREQLPDTRLHMLTNGRLFCYRWFAERLARVNHPNLTLGIPLYSDLAAMHDYVVQARDAFDQTMVGFHNLARYRQHIEIRIVIHKQTYRRLPQLAEFIYRNCPFAEHVALMGLELMGYTKKNLSQLWIDPVDYQDQLEEAVMYLSWAGMHVSIYNHQLCVLRNRLWPSARKSISDFKNIYLEECQQCSVLDRCGGLFKSAEQIHSRHIAPIPRAGHVDMETKIVFAQSDTERRGTGRGGSV